MRRSVLPLVLGAALWGALSISPVQSEPQPTATALVLGDSFTSKYTDDSGDPLQGWWSLIGDDRGWSMVTSAQGGGGIIKKGTGCYGTTIRERDAAVIDRVRPDWIIVAAGANDVWVCIDGHARKASTSWRTTAMIKEFAKIGTLADQYGIPRSHVVVTVPWGTLDGSARHELVTEIAGAATKAGLSWVNAPRFQSSQTLDGTHPNREGSEFLASVVLRRIGAAGG